MNTSKESVAGFNDYQVESFRTASYPEKGRGTIAALSYTALGLGEAGEVQGKVKKIWRDAGGQVTESMRDAIVAELGDVLWYVAALCTELKVPLEDVVSRNLRKLQDRQLRGVIGGSGDNR